MDSVTVKYFTIKLIILSFILVYEVKRYNNHFALANLTFYKGFAYGYFHWMCDTFIIKQQKEISHDA